MWKPLNDDTRKTLFSCVCVWAWLSSATSTAQTRRRRKAFFYMSTSKLQRYVSQQLSIHIGGYTIRENTRPEWLIAEDGARLELDFYIEELNAAIEVQGAQHYTFVEMFHGNYAGFQKRLAYDESKRTICAERGVLLYEVSSQSESDSAIGQISLSIPSVEFVPDKMISTKKYRPTREQTIAINKIKKLIKRCSTGNGTDESTAKRIAEIKKLARKHHLSLKDLIK